VTAAAVAPLCHRGTARRLQAVFNLQGGELIIIGLVALVVLGPEKLPDAARRLGRIIAQLRQMGDGFVDEFRQAVDEPIIELRRTVNDATSAFTQTDAGPTDPTRDGDAARGPATDAPSESSDGGTTA
jgi:Tat protein translocase TatB subunit